MAAIADLDLAGADLPVGACIDQDRYPITELDSEAGRALVAACRASMAATGACELPGFVRGEVLARVVAEAREVLPRAHPYRGLITPYLQMPDLSLPPDHVRRRFGRSATEVVAHDLIPASHLIRRLYEWDPLMDFLAAVLGHPRLHRYDCPMAGLNVVGMRAGDELWWHFDTVDFVTSIALAAPDAGGEFVYVPRLRSPADENEAAVAAVLDGAGPAGTLVPMTPGTMLLFEGRHSLHRVMPIEGDATRIVALLAYDTRPGTAPSPIAKLVRYGRTA